MIKKDNPDMTDDKIAYAIKVMNEKGIVAIRRRAQARHRRDDRRSAGKASTKPMADAGVFPKGLDAKKAYSLEFVNKGVGRDRLARHARGEISVSTIPASTVAVAGTALHRPPAGGRCLDP